MVPPVDDASVERAKVNVKRMLTARGIGGEDEEVALEFPGFLWALRRGDRWGVVFVDNVNKKTTTAVFTLCETLDHCVIVYRCKCTAPAEKEVMSHESTAMELFRMHEVLNCPIDSGMVPPYRLLPEAEAAIQRRRNLPIILTTEPVQRYYNAPVDSVYEVMTHDGALQPLVEYRQVRPPTC